MRSARWKTGARCPGPVQLIGGGKAGRASVGAAVTRKRSKLYINYVIYLIVVIQQT